MHVVCIGGGPAGLYLGILLKLRDPRHRVVIHERNRPAETFGFGVVFSAATLGNLEAADPVSYGELARHFARWDDIETFVGGQVLRSTGHGFCGLSRQQLLAILQERALGLGVELRFEDEIDAARFTEITRGADVVVACDGVGSWLRDAHREALGPTVDVRPNKFVWLGTTVPYRAFTFLFKETRFGLFRVHAYPFSVERSTFIVECRPETWQRAGFDTGDEAHTVAVLEELFAEELAGHRLIRNRSIWRNFPTVRCERWHSGNLVVLGDAVHTAHFSIGSGTKLAMEDSIELVAALAAVSDAAGGAEAAAPLEAAAVRGALAAYQARRKPEVEALQAAAQASLEWFEGTERVMHLPPAQFGYHLMTRSLRVSHASMRRRDPELAAAVEEMFGGKGRAPRQSPVEFCGAKLARRDEVALEGDRLTCGGEALGLLVATSGELAELRRLLAPLPGAGLPVGLALVDDPARRDALTAEVAALSPPPAFVLVAPSPAERGERLAGAPLADRLRNQLRLPTVLALDPATRDEDRDAVIAAGRADLVVSLPA